MRNIILTFGVIVYSAVLTERNGTKPKSIGVTEEK